MIQAMQQRSMTEGTTIAMISRCRGRRSRPPALKMEVEELLLGGYNSKIYSGIWVSTTCECIVEFLIV
jgi:hypothetical protein